MAWRENAPAHQEAPYADSTKTDIVIGVPAFQ